MKYNKGFNFLKPLLFLVAGTKKMSNQLLILELEKFNIQLKANPPLISTLFPVKNEDSSPAK